MVYLTYSTPGCEYFSASVYQEKFWNTTKASNVVRPRKTLQIAPVHFRII